MTYNKLSVFVVSVAAIIASCATSGLAASKAIHPVTRDSAVPAQGIIVAVNPPALLPAFTIRFSFHATAVLAMLRPSQAGTCGGRCSTHIASSAAARGTGDMRCRSKGNCAASHRCTVFRCRPRPGILLLQPSRKCLHPVLLLIQEY